MINLKRVVSAVAAAFLITAAAQAATYDIDPAHSSVQFKVKHLGISTVSGRFEKFTGSFDYDPADPDASKTSATIEVASINTDIDKRDDHLRSADFFAVDTHPQMTFVSKSVSDTSEAGFKLAGDLTLHGVTKPVVLDVETGGTVKDPWGKNRAAFTASTKINRKDFGLTWSKVLETGGLVVGEEVRIILEIEGIQKSD